ncbi:MAG TPA: class I SAM-dependent methyltransferase [Terracidiphilus sp.]|nr:class I SAM-dependent methyltransferase [Terracidiphilus sp.]
MKIARDKESRRRLPGLLVAEGYSRHPFDTEFGVRTSGLVAGRHLKSGHRHDRHATAYFGVAPSVFAELMARWRRSRPGMRVEEFAFVDAGAGMGRALLLAAEMPFRSVTGVELNPTLARIARRNAALWRAAGRARSRTKVVCGDVTEFRYPAGHCVLFLFNPFGATVMRKLMGSVARQFAERPEELDLIYVNNEQEGVLEGELGFARMFVGSVSRSRADARADKAILGNQPEGEYAYARYEECSTWRWMGRPERKHKAGGFSSGGN